MTKAINFTKILLINRKSSRLILKKSIRKSGKSLVCNLVDLSPSKESQCKSQRARTTTQTKSSCGSSKIARTTGPLGALKARSKDTLLKIWAKSIFQPEIQIMKIFNLMI